MLTAHSTSPSYGSFERSNFFKELPQILKKFWLLYIICIILIAGTIVMSLDRNSSFLDIFPLALLIGSHLLLPMVLNREYGSRDYSW
jgi:bacteriorhodopsin